MWKRTVGKQLLLVPNEVNTRLRPSLDPMEAPDKPTPFTVHFNEGVPVKLEVGDKVITGSLEIFKEVNEIGRVNGKDSDRPTF